MRRLALLLLFAVSVNSCGLILKGKKQKFEFTSNQSNVELWLDGKQIGLIQEETKTLYTMPDDKIVPREDKQNIARIKLERNRRHLIEFKKDGFTTRQVRIDKTANAGIIILDVVFGILPLLVDVATGTIYELEADTTYIELKEEK